MLNEWLPLSCASCIWSSAALPDQDLVPTKTHQLPHSLKYKPPQDVEFLLGLFSHSQDGLLKYRKASKLLTNVFWASKIIPWRPACSASLHTHQVPKATKHWDVIGKVLKKHKHQRQKARM